MGVEASAENDVTQLVHVRPREEIKAAEEIAQRNPCKDFDEFKPLFEKVQRELETGERQTVKYKKNAEIMKGDLFILDGQKVVVADLGERFVSDYGRPDRRLQSRLRQRHGERPSAPFAAARLVQGQGQPPHHAESGFGPLFSDDEDEGDLATGHIYVLRSKSEHPFVAEHRTLIHKIGVTGGDVKSRIANAKKDPTYLLADVEIVGEFKLANVNRKALERCCTNFSARPGWIWN